MKHSAMRSPPSFVCEDADRLNVTIGPTRGADQRRSTSMWQSGGMALTRPRYSLAHVRSQVRNGLHEQNTQRAVTSLRYLAGMVRVAGGELFGHHTKPSVGPASFSVGPRTMQGNHHLWSGLTSAVVQSITTRTVLYRRRDRRVSMYDASRFIIEPVFSIRKSSDAYFRVDKLLLMYVDRPRRRPAETLRRQRLCLIAAAMAMTRGARPADGNLLGGERADCFVAAFSFRPKNKEIFNENRESPLTTNSQKP
jgi:hypothetical protein